MGEIVVGFLSVYAISKLASEYDGPFDIIYRIRERFYKSAITCAVCLSVWAAVPIAVILGVGLIGYLSIIGLVVLAENIT